MMNAITLLQKRNGLNEKAIPLDKSSDYICCDGGCDSCSCDRGCGCDCSNDCYE